MEPRNDFNIFQFIVIGFNKHCEINITTKTAKKKSAVPRDEVLSL